MKHTIWAIDLDGVLNDSEKNGKPNWKVIEKINELQHDSNNFVVIYTARSIQKKLAVEHWLKQHSVNYDSLRFDKMKYDHILDDKSVFWKEVDYK